MLERHMARDPVPAQLLAALGVSPESAQAADAQKVRRTVHEHPELAAWYLLLAANAKFGGVHLMLTEKYLFKPQKVRDLSGIGDRPLVSNRAGTTGMDEPILVRLTRARRDHPLRFVGRVPDRELADLCGMRSLDFDGNRLPEAVFVDAPLR
jgi:hypothetical protein